MDCNTLLRSLPVPGLTVFTTQQGDSTSVQRL